MSGVWTDKYITADLNQLRNYRYEGVEQESMLRPRRNPVFV